MVFNPHAGFSSSSSTTKKPTRPTRERDYFGSMYTTSGGSGSTTSSSLNTGRVNPNDPVITQSIQDRKTAYESMRDAGMLTPSVSGISFYDKSPVIYPEGTTSEDILGADNPADIGGQQVDLKGTTVSDDFGGLTPFYTTYAEDAVNTGNITEDVYRYAISQGKTEEEANALVYQANQELNRLVSQYRTVDTEFDKENQATELDDFLAGYNPFFKNILPQTMYGEGIGVGGFTGSDTGYVGLEDETGRFFKIQDPTPNILANRSGFGGGGGMSFGGGSSYAAGIGSGLFGRPKQLGDAEKIPSQLRLLQYMVNVHRGNPYTKLAMRKKDGGLATIVGD
jgi:hypothetical protein